MPSRIIISNAQTQTRDCYVSAPKIDLTLRSNGEEEVQVMDPLGVFVKAGFVVPALASVITTTATVGTFTASKHWAYQYVYVAKERYPLVENASTPGGSPAPRSNPSPSGFTNSTVNSNVRQLSLKTSTREEISHIWIFRTELFDTLQQATDFAAAGNLFYIGEVVNDPNSVTVNFLDNGSMVGLEQIENDNFIAPQFLRCVYADPFFWGFGNDVLKTLVVLTLTGGITIIPDVSPEAATFATQWFNGRNGQVITFDGITSGGFDDRGSYYFKYLTSTTAQIYLDPLLSIPGTVDVIGTTRSYIRGSSTVLFRSKPRNPFAWGLTDLVGELQIPQPFTFVVGGGIGTAISIIPNLNLLKLDTEAPNKTYVLNLKNAGTPNFESSLRSIADNYSTSVHHSQFPATLDKGRTALWSLDSKSFAILECDGSVQVPISDAVFRTLRNLSLQSTDRLFFHGSYCPRLELNCIFVRIEGQEGSINTCIMHHYPTNQWSTLDVFDILCSSQILDRVANEIKLIVGTSTGLIGEMFAEGIYHNWYPNHVPNDGMTGGIGTVEFDPGLNFRTTAAHPAFDIVNPGIIGNWITIIQTPQVSGIAATYYCRIATVTAHILTFDLVLDINKKVTTYPGTKASYRAMQWGIGMIEMEIGKYFDADNPFTPKKLEQYLTTLKIEIQNVSSTPTLEFAAGYKPFTRAKEISLQPLQNASPDGDSTIWGLTTTIPLSFAKSFGIMFRDRNPSPTQIMNYEICFSADDGNRR